MNSSTFTWQDAFYQLVDMMNSGTASNIKSPLSLIQLIEIAEILEQNVSVEVHQFLLTYNLNSKFSEQMCQQIVKYFPVWWLHSSNDDILLNVHELFLMDGCLESLLSVHDEAQVNYTKSQRATKQDKGGGSKRDHSKSGRPALVEMFPDIVASEFIESHG